MWINIIIVVVFFVGVQVYLWYYGQQRKGGTDIAILRLLLGLLFATAAATTQIMAYNITSEYLSHISASETVLKYLPIVVSLLLGGTLDVAGVALWPTTIKLGINIVEKKRTGIKTLLRERYAFYFFIGLTVTISLISMALSFFSPIVVVEGISANTQDEVEVQERHIQSVDARVTTIERSISGLENQQARIVEGIQNAYPQYYQYAVEDKSAYYIRWINKKKEEKGYYELTKKIEELEVTKQRLIIESIDDGEELLTKTKEYNEEKEKSASTRKTILLYTLRYTGPGATVGTIFVIWGLVLLGFYNDRTVLDKGTSKTYVKEGNLILYKTKENDGSNNEEEEAVLEEEKPTNIKWDSTSNEVFYLHTMEGGPDVGKKYWKNLKWVRHQLAQNKSRLKVKTKEQERGAIVDLTTLEDNVRKWEEVVNNMQEELSKH